jgi:hypothetical protein
VVADLALIRVRVFDGIDTLLNHTDRPSHVDGGDGDDGIPGGRADTTSIGVGGADNDHIASGPGSARRASRPESELTLSRRSAHGL